MPKRLISVFEQYHEADVSPSLKLNANWKDAMFETNIVNLYFDVSVNCTFILQINYC